MKQLLGMNWLREFNWANENFVHATNEAEQSETSKIRAIFENQFRTKQKLKDTELKLLMKPNSSPIKRKPTPILFCLQNYTGNELNKLVICRFLEKFGEVSFCIPGSYNRKNDKQAKLAPGSGNSNDRCIKLKLHMPNMENY